MKQINNNIASKLAFAAFLALGTLTVTTSCNNNKNEVGQEIPDGKAQVIVRVAGINDSNPATQGKASTSSTKPGSSTELIQGNGFDLVTAVSDKIETNAAIKASSSGSKAAALPAGFKYRLFLYKKNGATYTFERSALFVAGQETPISVTDGATYKWVAISYNSTEDVPDRVGSDNYALPENKDVLYATSASDFTVAGASVPISVTFNHHLSRIAIELNTKGLFAKQNSATVTVSGLTAQTGTIDLTTGNFVGALTPAPITLDYSSFTDINTFGDRRVAYVYTAGQATQTVTVSLSNLKIQLDNGSERDFGATSMSKQFSFTPVRGSSHNLLLAPTESPLTYGGVQWSRSNLYYRTDINPENPYRFYHLNPVSNTANSFFSYGAAKPGVLARQVMPQDPCALVYPAGLWKTPAKADLNSINSAGLTGLLGDLNLNVLGSTLDVLIGAQNLLAANVTGATSSASSTYVEFTPTAGVSSAYGAATSASNRLRFNYNGLMRNINIVEDLIQLDLGTTYGKYAAFWTNDRALSLPLNLADLGVTHYLGNYYTGPLGINSGYKGFRSTNLLGISLLGSVDVIKSSLMNVRCVRDASFATTSVQPGYNPNPVLPN